MSGKGARAGRGRSLKYIAAFRTTNLYRLSISEAGPVVKLDEWVGAASRGKDGREGFLEQLSGDRLELRELRARG